MAKKNFDDFINAAGKKPKLTPEEVEAMAKQLHQPVEVPNIVNEEPRKPVKSKKVVRKEAIAPRSAKSIRNADSTETPREKVRITIDLAKDLYKRMKLAVVQNETEISAYVRNLIESDLSRK